MPSPVFIVYPNGYGTKDSIPVYDEADLQPLVDKYPDACMSSTAYYEQKMADKVNDLSKRWDKIKDG